MQLPADSKALYVAAVQSITALARRIPGASQRGGIRSLKVLLVENSRFLADRLSEVLGSVAGVELIGSTDTEAEAIAMMREHGADVVVLDLHLKQGTGFGVLRALAGANRKTTIIVLTNFDLPEFKKAAIALGATHFLDKARDYRRLPELLAEIGNKHLARH